MKEPDYEQIYKDWTYEALNQECINLVTQLSTKYPSRKALQQNLFRNSKHQALKKLMFEKRKGR